MHLVKYLLTLFLLSYRFSYFSHILAVMQKSEIDLKIGAPISFTRKKLVATKIVTFQLTIGFNVRMLNIYFVTVFMLGDPLKPFTST